MVRRRTAARKTKSATYTGLRRAQGAPARNGLLLLVLLGALVVLNLYVFVWDKESGVRALKHKAEATQPAMKISDRALSETHPAVPSPRSLRATPPAQIVEGRVEKADTLGKLLRHNGLNATEGDEVIRALSGVLDYKAIRPGAPYRIERSNDGRVLRFELEVSKNRHIRAVRKPSGELVGASD